MIRTFLRFVEESKAEAQYQHVATPLFTNPIRLRLEREMFTQRLHLAEDMLRRFRLDTTYSDQGRAYRDPGRRQDSRGRA